jgi:uncharacterized protein (TIGR02444 family)
VSSEPAIPVDLCLDEPLWQFAGSFWSRPLAREAALALQDRGWSVTDILCALWLALRHRRFPGFDSGPVVAWRHQVTEALRQVRKAIAKGNPATEQARGYVAQSELEAERVELALACRSLDSGAIARAGLNERSTRILALENLQAAAPEKAMDNETRILLSNLIDELQVFAEGDNPP